MHDVRGQHAFELKPYRESPPPCKRADLACAPWALLLAALSASSNAQGTYLDAEGNAALTLSSGTAQLHAGPVEMQMKYSVDDGKILLHGPAGGPDIVLTTHVDGTLDTPCGRWKKQ